MEIAVSLRKRTSASLCGRQPGQNLCLRSTPIENRLRQVRAGRRTRSNRRDRDSRLDTTRGVRKALHSCLSSLGLLAVFVSFVTHSSPPARCRKTSTTPSGTPSPTPSTTPSTAPSSGQLGAQQTKKQPANFFSNRCDRFAQSRCHRTGL